MTVKELIAELEKIEDKDTDIFLKQDADSIFGPIDIVARKKTLIYLEGNTGRKKQAYVLRSQARSK